MLRLFSTLERIVIVVLLLIFVGTSFYLYRRYIRDNSELIATDGGIYTEGLVGKPQFLNPVLLTGNTVDRDITQLIFSGLTRFNPHTGLIEDDIATSEKSKDNLSYTFTILPDAKWHDGVSVTADDVIFTYQGVIQDEKFPNVYLKQVFADVQVKKIDERTVRFILKEPYPFFLANVTIGLLPKHVLEVVPVENIDKYDFNQRPVGTGPYVFVSWTGNNDTNEITMVRNEEYYGAIPKIQTIILRIFPGQEALILAENILTGFRMGLGQNPEELFGKMSRYNFFDYTLPQYSALFLNTQSGILSNKKVRFALLLATNKEELAKLVGEAKVVDTPILESKADLDIEFSLERAMGAFFDTEWNLPEKLKSRNEGEEDGKSPDLNNSGVNKTDLNKNDGQGGPVDMKLIEDAAQLLFSLESVQDTWISLKVDGVPKPSFLLTEGNKKQFVAKSSLILTTVGNAAGLIINVNGLKLKKLGNEGQVLRNLILDKGSLGAYVDDSQMKELSKQGNEEQKEEKTDLVKNEEKEDGDPKKQEKPVVSKELVLEEEETKSVDKEELKKIRINSQGERLILRLVTVQDPPVYLEVAEAVQKQWLEAGAKVVIETYTMADLQEKLKKRDYDVLLFGQNLGYNLDAFPFWHSSQAESGLNLSNYRSLEADNLLVEIRKTFDERTKQEKLDKLKKVIAEDTPAIFLYNPIHYFVASKSVKNINLGKLSNHADRFTGLINWYTKEEYQLREPFSFSLLLRWIFSW